MKVDVTPAAMEPRSYLKLRHHKSDRYSGCGIPFVARLQRIAVSSPKLGAIVGCRAFSSRRVASRVKLQKGV